MTLDTRNIYRKIIEIASVFVKNRSWLTIEVVTNLNPTVEELAEIAKDIATTISNLSKDFSDENMAINASQCSIELRRLATAVRENDLDTMNQVLDRLAMYASSPY